MANIFREPLTLIQGTGVTITPNNTPLRAESREVVTIAIGNEVSTTSNPLFLSLTNTAQQFQINQYLIKPNSLTGSINLLGGLDTSTSLTVGGDMTVLGTTTVQKIESELTQSFTIFDSGSSIFGDTSDDSHRFSGSFSPSGSISLNNYSVHNISNDTSMTDGSATEIITENVAKTYIDNTGHENFQTYLRKCFAHTGSFVNSATSSFTAVTASAPSGITSTSENDFMFFINGQMIEHDGVSIQQTASTFLLKLDSSSVGYDLENSDDVVAWGKFNA